MDSLPTQIVEFDIENHQFSRLTLEQFEPDANNLNKIYWIHCDLSDGTSFQYFLDKLGFPEHVIKFCQPESKMNQLIDDTESLTLQIECLQSNGQMQSHDVYFENLVIYLTHQYCFTASFVAIPALSEFEKNYNKYLKHARTPCFILFLILDNILNDYSRILLDYEFLADSSDLQIREHAENIYDEVMHTKKQVMKIQHNVASFRDILMRISGRIISVISEQCRQSLSSLLDHSQIVFNEAQSIRDILRNNLDQIDNALMQRLNQTMKVLTAFAAIFLPLSLIPGIYGMNFEWLPELQWRYGYFWALGLMLGLGLAMFLIFRKKGWF